MMGSELPITTINFTPAALQGERHTLNNEVVICGFMIPMQLATDFTEEPWMTAAHVRS